MSSPIARRGAWAPDAVIDAPTPTLRTFTGRVRPTFDVAPASTQHSQGVRVQPSRNALTDVTRQDAKALGIPDVMKVDGAGATSGDTTTQGAQPEAAGCMPLP